MYLLVGLPAEGPTLKMQTVLHRRRRRWPQIVNWVLQRMCPVPAAKIITEGSNNMVYQHVRDVVLFTNLVGGMLCRLVFKITTTRRFTSVHSCMPWSLRSSQLPHECKVEAHKYMYASFMLQCIPVLSASILGKLTSSETSTSRYVAT